MSVPLKRRALRLGERVLLLLLAPPFVLSAPRLQTRSESSNVALAAFAAAVIARRHPFFADSGRASSESRSGCKNSGKIWWMMKFLNTETHTPVLLMKYLQSPHLRDVRIWVSTVLKLTLLKTEIARSVRGRKLQGPHAEDAMAEPYLVQELLVI